MIKIIKFWLSWMWAGIVRISNFSESVVKVWSFVYKIVLIVSIFGHFIGWKKLNETKKYLTKATIQRDSLKKENDSCKIQIIENKY